MLDDDGFALTPKVFTVTECDALLRELPEVTRGGARSLLEFPAVQHVAHALRSRGVVPPHFRAVRALLFDKTPDANWALQWHRDTSVALVARHELSGFGPWTVKDGVPHAIAPSALLAEMINVRVHLDPCGPEAGPLRVRRGSHLHGRSDGDEVVCTAEVGDVLAFKPLLLHASSSSVAPHRRVLQLECSPSELPAPLAWRWQV